MSQNTLDISDACYNDSVVVKPEDTYDDTVCDTCSIDKETGDAGFLNLRDGRQLCSDCSSIVVMDRMGYNCIIENVFQFYRSLNLKVDENIQILFIENKLMQKITYGSGDVKGCFIPSIWACIRGRLGCSLPIKIMCILSRLLCPIQTVEQNSKSTGNINKAWKRIIGDTILILYGKPDVDIGRLLAHEMMHAWLNHQGCPQRELERSAEEGICEVMAYKWLQWISSSGFDCSFKTSKQVQYTQKLIKVLVEDIECNKDKIYGQGYRDAMEAVERIGFQESLTHVLKNGTLPVVPLPEMIYGTCSTTTTPNTNLIIKKKTSSTPRTGLLWKMTKSIWNASVANLTGLLWKATTTYETPRFVIVGGHHRPHYHAGEIQLSLREGMFAPTILLFIGLVIEHK